MIARIDKRLFEILHENGVEVSIEAFKHAYTQRLEERAKDPKLAYRRKITQMVNGMMTDGD